jgi:L-lactate dehydrogenase complex protein LldG
MSDARTAVLARVRSALSDAPAPESIPRGYRRAGRRSDAERVELFCERVGDYRASVARVADVAGAVADAADRADVAGAVADACAERGATRLVIAPGLPDAWRPPGLTLVEDDGLDARSLDGFDGVITGCTVAIAETGTIALSAAPAEGRRAITLVPDLHVCVVLERQIVELVPEALAVLEPLVARERRPVTFISGPSATSDIELSRVEGVHGPRQLVVLVAS